MTKPQGIDWNAIFERRPDLEPPGYREANEIMRQKRNLKTPKD